MLISVHLHPYRISVYPNADKKAPSAVTLRSNIRPAAAHDYSHPNLPGPKV